MTPNTRDYDVAVVGGGIAGLITGLRCAERGCRAVILEKDAEPGGCVRLHRVGGLMLDRGAESFATSRQAVGRLAEKLGLAVERPAHAPAWIYHAHGQAPIPVGTLLGIPAHPTAADVRRVIGWLGVARAQLDRALPRARPQGSIADLPLSLGAVVSRRMGRRVLQRLVQPVAGGVYSVDPDEIDISAVAPDLARRLTEGRTLATAVAAIRGDGPAAGSAVAGIAGGMGLLSAKIANRFLAAGGVVRCGTEARTISRAAGSWRIGIGTESSTGDVVTASAVVLAVPGTVAARLIDQATGGEVRLPVSPPSQVRLVTLVLDEPALDRAPRGSGVLVAPNVTGVAATALTHATAKWRWLAEQAGPHRHVLRLSYGRAVSARNGGQLGAAGGDLLSVALRDASRLLGVRLTADQVGAHAEIAFRNQLAASRVSQAADRARFREQIAKVAGLSVVGSAVAGTGLSAIVASAIEAQLARCGCMGAGSSYDYC